AAVDRQVVIQACDDAPAPWKPDFARLRKLLATRTYDLLRLGRRLAHCPALREAYAVGRLSQCQAEQLARIVPRPWP
ncbi:MAG TPA: hypothetical protein VGO93_28565, partial [Candidatus Xenobia bacterium]